MRTILNLVRSHYKFYMVIALFILVFVGSNFAQSAPVSDEQLREQLTRAVQLWQEGKAVPAYATLDSIQSQPTTAENAGSKVKAAIWTATYLQAQKKFKPAANFLDSALTWAEVYARGEELRRTYEAYANYYLATGNSKAAILSQQASANLRDSMNAVLNQNKLDSIDAVIKNLQNQNEKLTLTIKESEKAQSDALNKTSLWNWGSGILIVILLVILFLMNGNLQRLKAAPPAPAPYIAPAKPEKEVPVVQAPNPTPVKKTFKKVVEKTENKEMDARAIEMSKDIKDLTSRLSKVELILIRPDIFALKTSGDSKAAVKILEEYVTGLPSIMRSLDDAIAENKAEGILVCISHIKPFIEKFGMEGTLLWINEIEEEAPEVKVNKLLSRVFQIRNHVRRAQDEAKAILEKVSF